MNDQSKPKNINCTAAISAKSCEGQRLGGDRSEFPYNCEDEIFDANRIIEAIRVDIKDNAPRPKDKTLAPA